MENLNTIYDLVKSYMGDNVCLSGSIALCLILNRLNIDHDIIPSDVDFVYTAKKSDHITYRRMGDYITKQDPQRSVTFSNIDGNSFDMTAVRIMKVVNINSLDIISPQQLLNCYRSDKDDVDEDDDRYDTLNKKILLLEKVMERLESSDEDYSDLLDITTINSTVKPDARDVDISPKRLF